MKKWWIHIGLLVCLPFAGKAQDFHFSQFTQSPLAINSAYAGVLPGADFRITNQYKRQWNRVSAPFRTLALGYDMALLDRTKRKPTRGFWGLGVTILSDREGTAKMGTTGITFHGSGSLYAGEYSTLTLGLSAGRTRRSMDFSGLTWDAQYNGFSFDSTLPTGEVETGMKTGWWDVGAGVLWNYVKPLGGKFDIGASAQHLTQPDISFEGYGADQLPMRINIHSKAEIPILRQDYTDNFIKPMGIFSMQGGHMEVAAGAMWKFRSQEPSRYTGLLRQIAFEYGLMYRLNDAIALMWRMEKENYAVGLSYDLTISNVREANRMRGGIELSFVWVGDLRGPKINRRIL